MDDIFILKIVIDIIIVVAHVVNTCRGTEPNGYHDNDDR